MKHNQWLVEIRAVARGLWNFQQPERQNEILVKAEKETPHKHIHTHP